MQQNKTLETATLAGGCFWCTEAVFDQVKGVEKVVVGYTGGSKANPSYEQVCMGNTGHAEAAQIEFDPSVISYKEILLIFFSTHDPTTLNRQGADRGTQYRSAIFYANEKQKTEAEEMIKSLTEKKIFDEPIVTHLEPLKEFYKAEDYHQNYFANNTQNGYCSAVINPKVAKLRKGFAKYLK
ncbi:MAG: peptide-methionine (S)-S-oxide reductase MsrA [Bacteroidota bacterium]